MRFNEQFVRSFYFDRSLEFDDAKYPFNIDSIRTLNNLELNPKVTFFIGENGSGKSTLLEGLAVSLGMNPEGGSHHINFKTRASHSILHEYLKVIRGIKRPKDSFFLRAESFYNLGTAYENLEDLPGKPPKDPLLHSCSHGESFFKIAFDRLKGSGLFLFDEPEAALSPQRQMSFVSRMHDLCKQNSQMVIATHSPIILSYPHSTIYQFSNEGIKKIAYEETEHFKVTKNYLNNYQIMLKELLED